MITEAVLAESGIFNDFKVLILEGGAIFSK